MVTVTQIANSNFVEMEIDGSIAAGEFDKALAKLNAIIEQYGSVRIVEIFRSMAMQPIS